MTKLTKGQKITIGIISALIVLVWRAAVFTLSLTKETTNQPP